MIRKMILAMGIVLLIFGYGRPFDAGPSVIYDDRGEAEQRIRAAIVRADKEDRRVLVVFGANWCTWCRSLHLMFTKDHDVARVLREKYVVVYVDVGEFNRNIELAEKYGVRELDDTGIPILVILGCQGEVLGVKDAGDFERAAGTGYSRGKILEYLRARAAM